MTEQFIRSQLMLLKPMVTGCSLEQARKYQDLIGELMAFSERSAVRTVIQDFRDFSAEWILPDKVHSDGVILYLHGGGYACGGLDYAKGFGSKLASDLGMKVLCCAYRLAPENAFPAAVEDSLTAYKYLLDSGFSPNRIILVGESAGGGLCYSLCIKLGVLGMELPAGVVAISPWTDLTLSGQSYKDNEKRDPSVAREQLEFFAESYTKDRENPLASPVFFEDSKFPPSLILVGGDEILRDDAVVMHQRLTERGFKSKLIVAENMWHVYILYDMKEHRADFDEISKFVGELIPMKAPRWVRLDNAAKIFPAARRKGWYSVFRVAAELYESVDPQILQSALNVTVTRFPTIAAKLKTGFFWYYLEEVKTPPVVRKDGFQPLMRHPFDDVRKCAIRVLYYNNRIAVEFFHAVTDGSGGAVFVKTLLAEYLTQKHDLKITCEKGVLNRQSCPEPEELQDSFLPNRGKVSAKRDEGKIYRIKGIPERDGYFNVTVGTLEADKVHEYSKQKSVTVTGFLTAVMLMSLMELQRQQVKKESKQLPVKIQIPVNLRKLFPSVTMRNFALYVNVGIDPRMGEYTLDEVIDIVHHQMSLMITKKSMQAAFTPNVNSELIPTVKAAPLFLKNIVLRAVFDQVGEGTSCLSISNLGMIELPDEMNPYVKSFDFVIVPQAAAPYNCGVCSFKNELRINFIRSSCDPELERIFFRHLVKLGFKVTIESNRREPFDRTGG